MASPPVAEAARELRLELLQAESVNRPEVLDRVRAAAPEVGVVCAFGQLIREELLSEVELLNVHPSLVPRWRGAAPIERAIMAGDQETGVAIMRVTAALDAGPIALVEPVPIGADDDYGSLAARLATIGGELIVRALDLRSAGELELVDQDESRATYAEKIAPEERRLDPRRPARELERRVRALNPHVGAYLELDGGGRLGVRAASAEEGELEAGRLAVDRGRLLLGCADGVLLLSRVQTPGGRTMPADAFLRGHPVPELAG